MTTPLLVLLVMIGLAVGACSAMWWRLRPSSARPQPATSLRSLAASATRHSPLQRLVSGDDVAFVEASPLSAKAKRRFRREREQILYLYVRDLRADFARLQRACRAIAKTADPTFGRLVMQQALRFWALSLLVQICCQVQWFSAARLYIKQLLAAFDDLQVAASRVALPISTEELLQATP